MISAFVTVRTQSSRLPNKCLLPFGKQTVLHHVLNRCISGGLRPIVCTTDLTSDDVLTDICDDLNVEYFRGSEKNKLQRWRDCCREFKVSSFHTVDADDPFFCVEEIQRSFNQLENGFDMVEPTKSSSSGGATVGYSIKSHVLEQVCANLKSTTDTEMMWTFIKAVPKLKITQLSEPDQNAISARMTLDYHEDYIFLSAILAILGPNATKASISNLLLTNPDLTLINEFRADEWANNQKLKISKAKLGAYRYE